MRREYFKVMNMSKLAIASCVPITRDPVRTVAIYPPRTARSGLRPQRTPAEHLNYGGSAYSSK